MVVVVAWSLGAGLLNRYGHGCIGRYICSCWWCCGCCGCGGWISAKLLMVVVVSEGKVVGGVMVVVVVG